MSETAGDGVVIIRAGRLTHLRAAPPHAPTVVYEFRERPAAAGTPAHSAARPAKPRTGSTSPTCEWVNLGFNCGGAVLAWVAWGR